jgi:DNA polymerase-3 subunit delta
MAPVATVNKVYPMITLLFGKDSFRSHVHLQKLIMTESEKGADIVLFDEDTFDIYSLYHHLRTQGLFTKEKLIVLKHVIPLLKENEKTTLLQLIPHLAPQTTIAFYERTTLEKRDNFIKQLIAFSKRDGKQYYPEYNPPNKSELSTWIRTECKKAQKEIDPEAVAYLVETYSDSWHLHNELDKLMNTFIVHITREALTEITSTKQLENNIFVLLDSLASKNAVRTLHLLKNHYDDGAEPLYILAMIARHVKILLKIKSLTSSHPLLTPAEIASRLSEHPFVIQKLYPLLGNFRLAKLVAIHEKLLTVDMQLKSTRIDPFTLLGALVYDIIGQSYDQRKARLPANNSRGESR